MKYRGFILDEFGKYRPEKTDLQLRLKKCSRPLGLPVCAVPARRGATESSLYDQLHPISTCVYVTHRHHPYAANYR